jgi:hypothetical protein
MPTLLFRPHSSFALWALSVLLATLCCTLAFAPAAMAAPRTRVSWRLPAATAGSPTSVNWSVSHQLPGSVLAIQRPVGTARVWRTVVRLSGSHGTANLPAYPLGNYRLRLAVIAGPDVLAQQQRVLHVFGKVPLGTLIGDSAEKGVYATPTTAFPYVTVFDDRIDGDQGQGVIRVSHSPCRSVFLEFVPGTDPGFPLPASDYAEEDGILSVVQQTRDPVSATTSFDGVNSVSASVVPGQSWSVNLSQSGGDGELLYFYVNGSAECDSTAALKQ